MLHQMGGFFTRTWKVLGAGLGTQHYRHLEEVPAATRDL